MTTASQTAPFNIEITAAPDIMDLHSDSGFDFGDGDIDLDLRSTGQQDDDLSIYDAGTDAGLEVQTASADQDDFMADNEDLIEEDVTVNYDDDVVVIVPDQQSMNQPGTGQQETANNEDDLIDYSDDDEEQTMWNDSEHVADPAEIGMEDNHLAEPADEEQPVAEPLQVAEIAAPEGLSQKHETGGSRHGDAEDEVHANNDDPQEFAVQQEDKQDGDEDATTDIEKSREVEEVEENEKTYDQLDVSSNSHEDTTLNEQAGHVQQEVHLHPVTVNYDGAELWLFKHHDSENSGDFLVEDGSLANRPLSSLLDACRTVLGSDVTAEMELGFRLDNFHNIELYQEHSSCAFITLEHLLNLYQQLHIQDGVSSPESFYMTLLFRPRVSALLSELSKAAAEGIGHLGLDRAIAAGLTAFNAHLSHNSTEHIAEDWGDAEENGVEQERGSSDDYELGERVEQVEDNKGPEIEAHEDTKEQPDGEYHLEKHEENRVEEESQPHVQSPGNATPPSAVNSVVNRSAKADGRTSIGSANVGSQPFADRSRSNTTQASPTSHQDEDDLIDYSDDEAGPEATLTGEAQATQPSSSSSTVQGDDTSYNQNDVQAFANDDDFHETGGEATYGYDEGETDGNFAHYEDVDSTYEGFDDQSFGDDYVEQNDEAHEQGSGNRQELEGYPTGLPAQTDDEDANQYNDVEHGNVDQLIDFSLPEFGDGDNHFLGQSTTAEDNSAGVEGFLEFRTAVSDADLSTGGQVASFTGEDDIEYEDEGEDGAAGQAPVAASAVVEPVATLASELLELSPQGQKRSIDEVGTDMGAATDISDAKRPRV